MVFRRTFMASLLMTLFVFSALTMTQDFVQAQSLPPNKSDAPTLIWEQYYENMASRWTDSIKFICQNDEDYILVASNDPHYYVSSVVLLNVNSSGSLLWHKRYLIAGSSGFAQTSDGGFVIAGALERVNPDFPWTPVGVEAIVLIKADDEGNMQWNRTYPHEELSSMTQTKDSGFVLVGTEQTSSNGISSAWVLKTDSRGKVQWNTTIDGLWRYGKLMQMTQTYDGGYAIVGHKYFDNGTYISSGEGSLVVLKLDSNGKLLWNKTINSGISNGSQKTIIQTSDEGYILTDSVGPTQIPTVVKIDSAGNVKWSRTYGMRGALDAVTQTSDGGLVFAGNLIEYSGYGHIWIVKTDSAGKVEWNQTFGGQKYIQNGYRSQCVIQAHDGTLMVGGVWVRSESIADYYLAKIDSGLPTPTPAPAPSIANPSSTTSNSGNLALAVILALIATAVTIGLAAYLKKENRPKSA